MSTFEGLWPKLKGSKRYREAFVAQHAKQAIPFQIGALLKQFKLTQAELAARARLTQGVVSRAADPEYGNLTINTLIRIAAGFDVAFVGRFVPFSELPKWFDRLYEQPLTVPSFEQEDAALHHQAFGPALEEYRQRFRMRVDNSRQLVSSGVSIVPQQMANEQLAKSSLSSEIAIQQMAQPDDNVVDFVMRKTQIEASRDNLSGQLAYKSAHAGNSSASTVLSHNGARNDRPAHVTTVKH